MNVSREPGACRRLQVEGQGRAGKRLSNRRTYDVPAHEKSRLTEIDTCLFNGFMSPKTPPGETREQIYQFMRDRLLAGKPPTVREVQARFGFKAVQTAQAHLEQLVAEGRLEKSLGDYKGHARGYSLPVSSVDHSSPPVFAPLLGAIQAGGLAEAIEDREGVVPVVRSGRRAGSEKLFALRVRGESMRDAGILPGDVVIVRVQNTANAGDIVVAMVDEEATVKTFKMRRGRVVLQPENPAFEEIVPDHVEILGKVIEVRRYID